MRYGGVEYAEAVPRTAPAVQDQSKDQSDLETEVIMTHAFNAQSLLWWWHPQQAGTGQR